MEVLLFYDLLDKVLNARNFILIYYNKLDLAPFGKNKISILSYWAITGV